MVSWDRIMKQYNYANETQRAFILTEVTKELQGCIQLISRLMCDLYGKKYYDDFYQAGVLSVVHNFTRYSPAVGITPEAFFAPYIEAEIYNVIDLYIKKRKSQKCAV